MQNKNFHVEGMYCSACQSLVIQAAEKTKNVKEAKVNLLTNVLTIYFDEDIDENELFKNIKGLGYSIYKTDFNKDNELLSMKKSILISIEKLGIALIFLILLCIFNFTNLLSANVTLFHIISLVGSFGVSIIYRDLYKKGFVSLFKKKPGMESLISISSIICLIYGSYISIKSFFNISTSSSENKFLLSNIMIIFFVFLGKFFEQLSKNKIYKKLLDFTSSLNIETLVKKENGYVKTKVEDLKKDDVLIVNVGEYIPLDGIILEGNGFVEETAITGESTPIFKNVGDCLKGGSLLQNGYVVFKVDKKFSENDMGKISTLLSGSSSSDLSFSHIVDQITKWFIPCILTISFLVLIVWLIVTKGNAAKSFNYCLSTLVVTCPCALGLAAPLCVSIGMILGLKNNIVFKNGKSLELISKVNFFAFDKTKTLTEGYLKICYHEDFKKDKDIDNAIYSLEKKSSHPLAMAIEKFFKDCSCKEVDITDVENILGLGIKAMYNGKKLLIGNYSLIKENLPKIAQIQEKHNGSSKVYICYDKDLIHYFEMKDVVKKEASFVIDSLKKESEIILISGDNEESTSLLASQVGIEKYYASSTPFNKETILTEAKKSINTHTYNNDLKRATARNNKFYTCMIGDGINDSLAINNSDIGISFGNASTITINKSEIICLDSNLNSILKARVISKRVIKRIKINIIFSCGYNAVLIPIAAGCFSSFGVNLEPAYSAIAMAASSLSVTISSLLLLKNNKI